MSGLLIVVAFPPWDFPFLIWIAPIPWILEQRRSSLKDGLWSAFWLSWIMTLGGFGWAAYAVREFGGVPLPLAIVGVAIAAWFGQLQFPFYSVLRRIIPPAWYRPAILALVYTAGDQFSPKIFKDTFGHSQYSVAATRQLAELTGTMGITFWIWWTAEALARPAEWAVSILLKRVGRIKAALPRPSRVEWSEVGTVLAAGLLISLWGSHRSSQLRAEWNSSTHRVRLAGIQANIGDFDKIASENGLQDAAMNVMHQYFMLSDRAMQAKPAPQAIIWPETSYPALFRSPSNSFEAARDHKLEEFVGSLGAPLWFGGYDHADDHDFNTLFFLEPDQPPKAPDLQIYHKSILLPFGEYIPFAEDWQWVHDAFPQVGFFGRGPGPTVYHLHPKGSDPIGVTPVICYEALFPEFGVEAARKGAQLLLNITNDSWFGPFGEPHLHLALSTFRGIETTLPQLRVTNTGVSALILPDGTITQATPLFTEQILQADIAVPPPGGFHRTLAVRLGGEWFGRLCLLLGAGVCLAGHTVQRRRRRRD
ncbi:MAG TPA: apolipoprotein N-acyltransferase [Bdellovibrionota bacterium]|nr:apolipoprotein N-acyltransferase [Bdellovibrionota bacterium]